MATVQNSPEQRRPVRRDVARVRAHAPRFGQRRGVRLTYDRGTLEFMTLSLEHERWGRFFNLLILALTLELGLPLQGGGSTTFRRRRKERGLEADECYWIANESLIRGKTKIDLRHDPPPDLTVEIDVTRSVLNRMNIYSALGVPEVWRYDTRTLSFHVLGPDGAYSTVSQSLAMPQVRSAELAPLLPLAGTMDENALSGNSRHGISRTSASKASRNCYWAMGCLKVRVAWRLAKLGKMLL